MKSPQWVQKIWKLLFFSVLFTACMALAPNSGHASSRGAGVQGPPSFADLADQVNHAVVNISTTQVVRESPMQPFFGPNSPFREFFGDEFFRRFFGGEMPQEQSRRSALGSGFIVDEKEGLIITNNHVVERADEIRIRTERGKEYEATVVGRDSKTDLALIQVKPDADFPKAAVLGDSDKLRVGDWVMAVGNPFGLGNTVTAGIISAKGRVIGAGPYDDFLQTDAAINPGNSGGPLFNMKGQVVGINTAIVAQGQGIGFAIPVNVANELIPQLKAGKVVRGWLGVMIQDITPELAQSFGITETKGVIISDIVPEGPADKSDLQRGDVVLTFEGKPVENANGLSRMVAATTPGTRANLQVLRNGTRERVRVTIGTMPDDTQEPEAVQEEAAWGLSVQNLTPEMAQRFGWDRNETGVVVTGVAPGSPAAEGRIRTGDLIQEINRQRIQNMRDYNQAVTKPQEGETLLLLIKRGQNTFYVALRAPGTP